MPALRNCARLTVLFTLVISLSVLAVDATPLTNGPIPSSGSRAPLSLKDSSAESTKGKLQDKTTAKDDNAAAADKSGKDGVTKEGRSSPTKDAEVDGNQEVQSEVAQDMKELDQEQNPDQIELDKCTKHGVPAARTKTAADMNAKIECETLLRKAENGVGSKEDEANEKQAALHKVMEELKKGVATEKEARQLEYDAAHARHAEIQACKGRVHLAKEGLAAAIGKIQNELSVAENKLKSREAELTEHMRKRVLAEQERIGAQLEAQEQAAKNDASAAQAQAQHEEEVEMQEAEQTLALTKEEARAHATNELTNAIAETEEKIQEVETEKETHVSELMQQLITLKEEQTNLETRLEQAKEYEEHDLRQKEELAAEEKRFRQWYNQEGGSLEVAKSELDVASEVAADSVKKQQKIAEDMKSAIEASPKQ